MICDHCQFDTDRLHVTDWHTADGDGNGHGLAELVATMMTEPVTHRLPPGWQGTYSAERARSWIAERDREGPTLLAVERSSGKAVGLLVLFESPIPDRDGIDVRLGYLLAETAWGRGLATEMVGGFVGWCRSEPAIRSLAGGAELTNVASRRVLEKNGFRPLAPHEGTDDTILGLRLHPPVLYLLTGLPCSGKTTHAEQLEAGGAARISVDDAMVRTHGRLGIDYDVSEHAERLEPIVTAARERIGEHLAAGSDVVLDHGLGSRAERDDFKRVAEQHGATWQLLCFDADLATLRARCHSRASIEGTVPITEEAFTFLAAAWERPAGEGEILVRSTTSL